MHITVNPQAQAILDAALQTPSVKALFEEIAQGASINVKYEPDGTWNSSLSNGIAAITITPTDAPAAALAHELLHCQLKLAGYRQYLSMVSLTEKRETLKDIIEALDNEVQHHRFFPKFLALGLPPGEFYHDSDEDSFAYVRKTAKKLTSQSDVEGFLFLFLTVIAPGGMGSEKDRRKLRGFLKSRCSSATWDVLVKIEALISEWAQSDLVEVGNCFAGIVRQLPGYEQSWIGKSQNFPGDGIFIGEPFTLEEAEDWLQKHS